MKYKVHGWAVAVTLTKNDQQGTINICTTLNVYPALTFSELEAKAQATIKSMGEYPAHQVFSIIAAEISTGQRPEAPPSEEQKNGSP